MCNLCLGEIKTGYRVPDSRRGAELFICPACGMVSSRFTRAEPERIVTLSSGPDWGNVRVGKPLRLQAAIPWLEQLNWKRIRRVLDVGSSRGDFLRWVAEHHPGVALVGYEPDASVIADYPGGVVIRPRAFDRADIEQPFDLIYACHTLEHIANPLDWLRMLHWALEPDGRIYIDVPNIQAAERADVVEEFFIDKHMQHFSPGTLLQLLRLARFDPVAIHADTDNIQVVARKLGTFDAVGYYKRLEANRTRMGEVCQRMRDLAGGKIAAIWGCGRLLDALRKWGDLDVSDYQLIDTYLAGREICGKTIQPPEQLYAEVVFILARSSVPEIKKQISAQVYTWADLWT